MVALTDKAEDARSRIIQTAVTLFASKGASDVSLRELTAQAGVNVAAVNYYFQSRSGLEEAVFEDVAKRVNRQRQAALQAILQKAGDAKVPPSLQAIIESFISPYLENANEGALLAQLILKHRVAPTALTRRLIRTHFDPMAKRYVNALALANPNVDGDEFVWRYMFMTSVVVLTATDRGAINRVSSISSGKLNATDTDQLKAALMRFLVGGLTATGN